MAAGSRWRDTGLVFTTAQGGFIEPRNGKRMFHNLCRKANVPQLRVHDLRHSCATLLFTMGVQPATVQGILRHSSITVTTGTYVEVIEAVQRDAPDSMGAQGTRTPALCCKNTARSAVIVFQRCYVGDQCPADIPDRVTWRNSAGLSLGTLGNDLLPLRFVAVDQSQICSSERT